MTKLLRRHRQPTMLSWVAGKSTPSSGCLEFANGVRPIFISGRHDDSLGSLPITAIAAEVDGVPVIGLLAIDVVDFSGPLLLPRRSLALIRGELDFSKNSVELAEMSILLLFRHRVVIFYCQSSRLRIRCRRLVPQTVSTHLAMRSALRKM